MTAARDRYAAERARQLKAQARRTAADPQHGSNRDPRETVAALMAPCTNWAADWRPCAHPQLSHMTSDAGAVTWCSITTAAGPCGCEQHQGGRLHDFGPDGTELTCRACGLHLLDIAGLCEPA